MSNGISSDTHGLPHLSRRLAFMDADFGSAFKLQYNPSLQSEALRLEVFWFFSSEKNTPVTLVTLQLPVKGFSCRGE